MPNEYVLNLGQAHMAGSLILLICLALGMAAVFTAIMGWLFRTATIMEMRRVAFVDMRSLVKFVAGASRRVANIARS